MPAHLRTNAQPPLPGFMLIGSTEGMSPDVPPPGSVHGELPDPPRYVRTPLYACMACWHTMLYAGQSRHRCWEGLC